MAGRPNGWVGRIPGERYPTRLSSRGPLETWEFPVAPGFEPCRPGSVVNPQNPGFTQCKRERRVGDGNRRTTPRAESSSGCRTPVPRQRQQQHNNMPTTNTYVHLILAVSHCVVGPRGARRGRHIVSRPLAHPACSLRARAHVLICSTSCAFKSQTCHTPH